MSEHVGKGPEAKRLAGDPGVPYRRYFWWLSCAWTTVVAASLVWSLIELAEDVRAQTSVAARALLEKDLLYRQWSLLTGGVYVPAAGSGSEQTGAPALDAEREIVTPSGQRLTLLNPAVVSRQIFAVQERQMGIRGRLTSLKPIRPTNSPDPWERHALEEFEKGAEEVSTTEVRQGERYFRMMRPLVLVPACLRCHEEQGRRPGEVRGGISVTVPTSRFATPGENLRLACAHGALWLVGLVGLSFGTSDLRRHLHRRHLAEAEREQLIAQLQGALAKVKLLSGLIPICASCKKIRDDQGYWTELERYLQQHSEAEFSSGLCPECAKRLYPEFWPELEARQKPSPPAPPGK